MRENEKNKRQFNYQFIKTRSKVEITFEILKGKFFCLKRPIDMNPTVIKEITSVSLQMPSLLIKDEIYFEEFSKFSMSVNITN